MCWLARLHREGEETEDEDVVAGREVTRVPSRYSRPLGSLARGRCKGEETEDEDVVARAGTPRGRGD
jgi:hypothetical protein